MQRKANLRPGQPGKGMVLGSGDGGWVGGGVRLECSDVGGWGTGLIEKLGVGEAGNPVQQDGQ